MRAKSLLDKAFKAVFLPFLRLALPFYPVNLPFLRCYPQSPLSNQGRRAVFSLIAFGENRRKFGRVDGIEEAGQVRRG